MLFGAAIFGLGMWVGNNFQDWFGTSDFQKQSPAVQKIVISEVNTAVDDIKKAAVAYRESKLDSAAQYLKRAMGKLNTVQFYNKDLYVKIDTDLKDLMNIISDSNSIDTLITNYVKQFSELLFSKQRALKKYRIDNKKYVGEIQVTKIPEDFEWGFDKLKNSLSELKAYINDLSGSKDITENAKKGFNNTIGSIIKMLNEYKKSFESLKKAVPQIAAPGYEDLIKVLNKHISDISSLKI